MNTLNDHDIDDLARRAGAELRRPAPQGGLARIERGARRQQRVRLAAATAAVAAVIVTIGLVATRDREASRVVPATVPTTLALPTLVPPTTVPPATVAVATVPSETAPASTGVPATLPPTTLPAPTTTALPVVQPTALHINPSPTDGTPTGDAWDSQELLDLTTGQVTGTKPTLDGWDSGPYTADARRTSADGSITYSLYDPDVAHEDACGQVALTAVGAPAATALPARALFATLSADGRHLAVVHGTCPTAGGVTNGVLVPLAAEVTVFDADHPETTGRTLASYQPQLGATAVTSVAFVADDHTLIVDHDVPGGAKTVFDVMTGAEHDVLQGCSADPYGTVHRVEGRPAIWALVTCNGAMYLTIEDLATHSGARFLVPGISPTSAALAVVDGQSYTSPTDAWWAVSGASADGTRQLAQLGHGSRMVSIPAFDRASFQPLHATAHSTGTAPAVGDVPGVMLPPDATNG